jgi:hypothetical protein
VIVGIGFVCVVEGPSVDVTMRSRLATTSSVHARTLRGPLTGEGKVARSYGSPLV